MQTVEAVASAMRIAGAYFHRDNLGHPALSSAVAAFRARRRHRMFDAIEAARHKQRADTSALDDGSLGPAGLYDEGSTVGDASKKASKPAVQCRMLYEIVRAAAPMRILELGTNVGISSAYIAAAAPRARLVTLDVSPYRQRAARVLHDELGLGNIKYVTGLFVDTLDETLAQLGTVDLAFIDGHHQYQPTLDYTEQIDRAAAPGAIFLFDDIRWSEGMERAWAKISIDPRFDLALDLDKIGVTVKGTAPGAPRLKRIPDLFG